MTPSKQAAPSIAAENLSDALDKIRGAIARLEQYEQSLGGGPALNAGDATLTLMRHTRMDLAVALGYLTRPATRTMRAPGAKQLERWAEDGIAKATDGCMVEPDGTCPHGNPSWLLKLGLI